MLNSSSFDDNNACPSSPPRFVNDECLSPIFNCSPNAGAKRHTSSVTVGDVIKDFVLCFSSSMSLRMKMQVLHHIFKQCVIAEDGQDFFRFVNNDFLPRSLGAMKTLFRESKPNLIYGLSKCFEGTSPRMSLNRMPYGLIDYNIRFFASDTTVNLHMEEHYASWLEAMYTQFGHKWLCLHRGPMWQYERGADWEKDLPTTNDPEHSTDVVEVDIIREALQHSSIDLDTAPPDNMEEGLEIFEHVDLSICNLSITDNTVTTPTTCEDLQTDSPIFPSPEFVNEEVYLEMIEHVDLSICNLSISDNALTTPTSCEDLQTDSPSIPSPEFVNEEEPLQVSHLWTSMSKGDKQDMALGLVSCKELEKLHGIQATSKGSRRQHNPDMYDPLKVSCITNTVFTC